MGGGQHQIIPRLGGHSQVLEYRGNPGILPPRLFPLAWGFPLLLLVFFLWLWGFRSCSWFFSSSEMCVYFLFLGFDQKADQPVCIELWHFQLPAPRKVPRCLHLIQGRHLVLKPTNFERGRIRPIWVSDLRKRPLIGVSRSLIYEQRTEPKPGARAHIPRPLSVAGILGLGRWIRSQKFDARRFGHLAA